MGADRSRLPALGSEPAFTFPAIHRTVLANGLRVWTVPHHQVPLVSLLALVPVGASSDPSDRPGLAAITVGIWIVQILWSRWWMDRCAMGPLEWLWRRLYRGPTPMLRPAPTPVVP